MSEIIDDEHVHNTPTSVRVLKCSNYLINSIKYRNTFNAIQIYKFQKQYIHTTFT